MASTFGDQTGYGYGIGLTLLLGGTGVWLDVWDPAEAARLIEAAKCLRDCCRTCGEDAEAPGRSRAGRRVEDGCEPPVPGQRPSPLARPQGPELLDVRAREAHRRAAARRGMVGLGLGVWLGVGGGQPGWAHEAMYQDQTVPDAAAQLPGVLERAFEERLRKKTVFPRLQEFLETEPPFFRDTQVSLHLRTNFAWGTGARDPSTGQALADERELDLTVDYRVTRKGWLEGLWLRLRGVILQQGGSSLEEIRLILNSEFPVL